MGDNVNHPAHYGGKGNLYEAIKVIEAWDLDFNLGNVVKYIARAGKKESVPALEDLRKAAWYLDRAIERETLKPVPVKSGLDSLRPANAPDTDTVPVCLKCGGRPQIMSSTEGTVYAQCRKCGWKTEPRDTEEKALDAWCGQMMFGKKEDMRWRMMRRP